MYYKDQQPLARQKINIDNQVSDPELEEFIKNRIVAYNKRSQHEIYPKSFTYKSFSSEIQNKIKLFASIMQEMQEKNEQEIIKKTFKKVNELTKKKPVKISEMRTSLGFRICSIDQDHFDPEGYDFRKLSDDPEKYLMINFPIPFRFNPDKE